MDKIVKQPEVSVIMPVYNTEAFIREAVESILNQTFADFELIIIDDCSTDHTPAIINSYTDPRIRFITKPAHSGLINSLNIGLSLSNGEYIARMDSDDISYPTRLAKQVDFLNSYPDIVLCGTWFHTMQPKDVVKHPTHPDDTKIALLDYCCFSHPTVMFRKSFIDRYKLHFDLLFTSCEDYDMWTKMVCHGKLANLPEPLLAYRLHENQITFKDQYNQVKNSNICRVRMMCYPLTNITEADIKTGELIIKHKPINNIHQLKNVLDWLDHLFKSNKQTGFYDVPLFEKYIKNKRASLSRRFFLNEISIYNPNLLVGYVRSYKYFKDHFSKAEHYKFALKCLMFWKLGAKQQS